MSLLKLKNTPKLADIEAATKNAFLKVKEELDEHLEAINENTTENKTTYNRLRVLEDKVDKLSEKMDKILAHFGEKKTYDIAELSLREQEIFIAIAFFASQPASTMAMAVSEVLCLSWSTT